MSLVKVVGLVNWWRVKRMRDPADGSLLVTVCPQPECALEASSYSALMLGVVSAPGLRPTSVEFSCTVLAKRCPRSKQRIPVVVDRADPCRVVIKWDRVPVRDSLGSARAYAREQAASARRQSKR